MSEEDDERAPQHDGQVVRAESLHCAFAGVVASQVLYIESEIVGLLLSGHAEAPGSSPGVRNDLHMTQRMWFKGKISASHDGVLLFLVAG